MKGSLRITKRDRDLFKLLWRLKISTTEYINRMIFPGKHPRTAYSRLRILRMHNYVLVHTSKDCKEKLWQLDVKGFNCIKDDIMSLKELGFRTESPTHDNKVNVIQLGIFDTLESKNVSLITEQELRRLDSNIFPDGIPRIGHRPDGFWMFESEDGKQNIVSIEVELSKKKNADYENIVMFYDMEEDIKAVVWIFESEAFANRVSEFLKLTSGENQNKHFFILFDEFIKKNTDSSIIAGRHKGAKLSSKLQELGAVKANTNNKHVLTSSLANTKIRCWK